MKRTQLIDALAARFEGNRKLAADALDAVLDTITREVARGEKVAIKGFGTFEKVLPKKAVKNAAKNAEQSKKASKKKPFVPQFMAAKELTGVVSGAIKLPKLPTVPVAKGVADETPAPAGTGAQESNEAADAKRGEVTPEPTTATKTTAAKKSSAATKAPAKKAATAKKATKTPAAKAPTQKAAAAKSGAAKTNTAKKTPAKKTTAKTATAKTATAKQTATPKKTTQS